jgi:BolA family transcriptional regulator, general stress-responsive regulator
MENDIQSLIRERLAQLNPECCELIDDSHRHAGHVGAKSGGHFRLTIVSAQFSGMSLVARHRRVFSLLDALMQSRIHALNINALAPEEVRKDSSPV